MRLFTIYFILLLICASCTEEKEFPFNNDVPLPVTLQYEELTESGVTLRADLISEGTQEVISYGFMWNYDNLDFRHNLESPFGGPYSYRVTSDLQPGRKYSYRAFVQTTETIFLGNQVTFTAKGSSIPVITKIDPIAASRGETVTVFADHLSNIASRNKLRINNRTINPVSQTTNSLSFIVADNLPAGPIPIQVQAGELRSEVNEEFSVVGPRITNISKTEADPMEVITVSSPYFGQANTSNVVYFKRISTTFYPNVKAHILEEGVGYARIAVPENTGQNKIILEVNGFLGDVEAAPEIMVGPLWEELGYISGVSQAVWFTYQNKIYASGLFLQKLMSYDPVTLNAQPMFNLKPAYHEWIFPGNDKVYRFNQQNGIGDLEVSTIEFDIDQELYFNTYPLSSTLASALRGAGGSDYSYFVGTDKSVWEFNMTSGGLTRKADVGIDEKFGRRNYIPFVKEGILYVLTTNKTVQYQRSTNTWIEYSNHDLQNASLTRIISYNGQLYLFTDIGMFKFYEEFKTWALITKNNTNVNNYYDFNGLHVLSNVSTVLKLLPE